jgi:hypothetical protein
LRDAEAQPLFTVQQVAQSVESDHRQAAGCHVDTVRAGGEEFKAVILRQRQVDEVVVEAVQVEIMRDPLVETAEVCRRVTARVGRDDLSAATSEAALAQISCREVRQVVRGRLAAGAVHDQEEWVLETLRHQGATGRNVPAGIEVPPREEPRLVDPTAMRTLLPPGAAMAAVPEALRWVGVVLTVYSWGVPLSRLGQGVGVHTTTLLRWVVGLVGALWGEVAGWIVERIRGGVVMADEKWLTIRGRWVSWCVVVDAATESPLVTYLSPTRGVWACR